MGDNEVMVGFVQTRGKVDADGDQVYHVKQYDEAGVLLKKPVVEETQQGHGFRVMHVDMLGRIARRLTELGFEDHIPGIVGWLTEQPPEPKQIKPMTLKLVKLEEEARGRARKADNRADRRRELRDAAYFEAAAFCWHAWRPTSR